jgi:hypothetical protein
MPKLLTYSERRTFCFSKQQIRAFEIMESLNVNVSVFVREAIQEKIKREYKQIKEKQNKLRLPF